VIQCTYATCHTERVDHVCIPICKIHIQFDGDMSYRARVVHADLSSVHMHSLNGFTQLLSAGVVEPGHVCGGSAAANYIYMIYFVLVRIDIHSPFCSTRYKTMYSGVTGIDSRPMLTMVRPY
jgi:hypothetical protein